jgi:uncharacterized protein (DUF4415 family)
MATRLPEIDVNGEVSDLSNVSKGVFKPAHEVLPLELQKTLGMKSRGPQKSPTKKATTIRLSPEVMDAFRATGAGWQTRIDAALKDWLRAHQQL